MSVRQADWFPKPWFLQQFFVVFGVGMFCAQVPEVLRFVGMLHF